MVIIRSMIDFTVSSWLYDKIFHTALVQYTKDALFKIVLILGFTTEMQVRIEVP